MPQNPDFALPRNYHLRPMQQIIHHCWELTPDEAETLQADLAAQVITTDQFDPINTIAGVDVAYDSHSNKLVAAVVVLDARSLAVLETATATDIERFPYLPGLFSFCELPPLAKALGQLQIRPDLIVCDGQGLAHPRRFGLACHLGVVFDIPTIGCARTRLVGEAPDPGMARGDFTPLTDRGEVVGRILRTQTGVKPVYVSVGHRISLPTAGDVVFSLCNKYRLPETTRLADQAVNKLLKQI